MEVLLADLLEMGFSKQRAEKALQATGCKSVVEAMDWLIAHEEDDITEQETNSGDAVQIVHEKIKETVSASVKPKREANNSELSTSKTTTVSAQSGPQIAEVVSYKCDECDKKFRNVNEVEFHAAKSSHSKFSESNEMLKNLTTEELQAKALDLQQLIKQRREQREAEELKKAIEAEKLRRHQGQNIQLSRQEKQELEMKKIVEDRKQEKLADQAARKRVLEQIQRDREARQKDQKKESDSVVQNGASDKNAKSSKANATLQQNDYVAAPASEHCRIQVRLLDGKTLSHTFGAKEPLSAVRLFVELNRTDDKLVPFDLVQPFPKRLFRDEHMDATLEGLGLAPSSNLMLSRKLGAFQN